MLRRAGSVSLAVLSLAALAAAPALAEEGKIKVGDVLPYAAETPHPYPKTWTDRVFSPGAEFVRVHFTGLHLGAGDSLTVSSPDGSQVWTYTGEGPHGNGDVWSFAIDGDTAIVALQGGRGNGYGYRITEVGHGTMNISGKKNPPTLEVVCGTDGREDIACHLPALDSLSRPVNRMLFVQGAFQYVCTGWLVAGSSSSTMMTNNHCISTQSVANTLQALFNYQRTTCGGGTNASTTSYAGGTLLKTHKKLDYTLMTLQGNPEATWGELTATSLKGTVGQLLYFIQHPGGNEKEIGYWENADHATRCDVELIDRTYQGTTAGSQMAYSCDSEGGSSGSPIINAATGRVFGLHHFGGVSSSPCRNAATEMPEICANAGALLSCASN